MRSINILVKACLYKEGAVVFLVTGIILYCMAFMAASYGSMNDVFRVFTGLGVASVSAILVVMMASSVHVLETRKTILFLYNVRVSILQAAFFVCVCASIFVAPYFYLVGVGGFDVVVVVFPTFFAIYSLIFISGLLLAKYISPALTFAIVLLAIPAALFLIAYTTSRFHAIAIVIVGVVILWPIFSVYWLHKKQEAFIDNGQNWSLRIAAWLSRLMHFPHHSSLVGTMLLNNGDSGQSMVKRSLIVLAISSTVLLIPYLLSVSEKSLESPKILFIFFAFQFVYVEFSRGYKISKSIWLFGDGDRINIFKRRTVLHIKLAAIHYGLFVFILIFFQSWVSVGGSAENVSILILIAYYLVMHLFFVCIPADINSLTIAPFLYFPLAFGWEVFDVNGSLVVTDNFFEIFLVFGFPPVVVFIAALATKRLKKYDFSRQLMRHGMLARQVR
jgi:hypothetical protein